MILERHRELTINLGNNTFESVKISARVSLDDDKDMDVKLILAAGDSAKAADRILTEALASEVEYWEAITLKENSFIHLVQADNKAKEQETKNA